jgi:hypothetical protein
VIKDGYAELPKGYGLGTKLNPDLFVPGPDYRVSQI